MDGKVCTKCGEFKDYKEYHKNKTYKDGRNGKCKVCRAEIDKLYYQKNRERHNKRTKEYYEENKEKILNKCKEYREENKERIAESKKNWAARNKVRKSEQEKRWRENNEERNIKMKKKWYKKNRDRVYSNLLKRRSLKHYVRFEGVRRKKLLDRDNWTCRRCGTWVHDLNVGGNENRHLWDNEHKAHIDHIIPISKGGDSTIENLQVLCRTCNLSKSDKTEIGFEI
ncbi:HNH endonuclease [Bacillus thuringiensis]|nr:HNH endonuclease [Bacillus thuringiensis]OUB48209.1 hypothetical protein BK716_19695 [Bacillus thuringiensis serovar higo]